METLTQDNDQWTRNPLVTSHINLTALMLCPSGHNEGWHPLPLGPPSGGLHTPQGLNGPLRKYAKCQGLCKVHNSHCCICSSGISPYYSIYNRSLVGFCGCFTSYIVSANDYVKHLYFCYLLTSVITAIDHTSTQLLDKLSTLLLHLPAAR